MKKKLKNAKRKNERRNFYNKFYTITQQISYEETTTYSHIAEACGIKSAARNVVWVLNG